MEVVATVVAAAAVGRVAKAVMEVEAGMVVVEEVLVVQVVVQVVAAPATAAEAVAMVATAATEVVAPTADTQVVTSVVDSQEAARAAGLVAAGKQAEGAATNMREDMRRSGSPGAQSQTGNLQRPAASQSHSQLLTSRTGASA